MRIVVLFFSSVFLWVTQLDDLSSSEASAGRPEAKLDGELYLYEKNPSSGSFVPWGLGEK